MKNLKDIILESRAEDYLDFEGLLDDFLKDTDKEDWTYAALYAYCEDEEMTHGEYDEFEDWVKEYHKDLLLEE